MRIIAAALVCDFYYSTADRKLGYYGITLDWIRSLGVSQTILCASTLTVLSIWIEVWNSWIHAQAMKAPQSLTSYLSARKSAVVPPAEFGFEDTPPAKNQKKKATKGKREELQTPAVTAGGNKKKAKKNAQPSEDEVVELRLVEKPKKKTNAQVQAQVKKQQANNRGSGARSRGKKR
jgi:hypothetical protein